MTVCPHCGEGHSTKFPCSARLKTAVCMFCGQNHGRDQCPARKRAFEDMARNKPGPRKGSWQR
jgi:hypothetical protein